MADTSGQANPPLINDLISHGHEFSFSQVMRIARLHLGAGGAGELPEVPWQARIRVRPDLSLAFPAADVARVERSGQNGADLLITTTFLGLYGSSSPLPTHYTEDLLDEASADSSVSRDFLDILHQRLYQLYFQCWGKYQLFNQVAEEKNTKDRERLFCLIGLGEKELRDSVPDPWSLVRYAGLLTQFPRSAEGLQTLLRDALGVRKLEVEQCVLRRVPIPKDQQMRLGISGMSLGLSTVLGSEIADRMGKFRILIGPLSKKEFDTLLPGTPQHDKLASLIRLYILDPFDFDLQMTLAAKEAEPIRLGDPDGAKLGWNSWCFAGATLGETTALFPIAHSATPAPSTEVGYAPEFKEPSSLIDYYQQELSKLRDLAADYAISHPELSAMVSGHLADAGVERLFEGVAFLNANLQQKLDDNFPEIIHDLIDAIQPNYLRPIPATTIVAFTPKANCTGSQTIPAGTELKSIPIDGTECLFTTSYPVEIHPLEITGANFAQPSGQPPAITIKFKLSDMGLSTWEMNTLRLFLAGEQNDAANLYLVLMRYLKMIVITPLQYGQTHTLDATHLRAVGFEDEELLFPTNSSATSHQLLLEYFIQPNKYLFIDLQGLEKWLDRGDGMEFEVRFELEKLPFALHQLTKADFELFATPAANLFKHQAKPLSVTDRKAEYRIRPEGINAEHYQVYSLEKVSGFVRGHANAISYLPHEQYTGRTGDSPLFKLRKRKSELRSSIDFNIAVIDRAMTKLPASELLDISLTCTNSALPSNLVVGDLCIPNANSPVFATFSNIKVITRSANPRLANNQLWKHFSLFGTNLHLINCKSLISLLETYILSDCRDYKEVKTYQMRLEGIVGLRIAAIDRLFGGSMQRGWEIRIRLQKDCFTSNGEMYLFSAMLERFMALFATQSAFTLTVIEDVQGTLEYRWPERMGKRPLL
ncbi:MAG: type VI secretion system baseplate subunit TssF [Verrucomicrobia bacterium]|nr:type VI secretion system baseplate subunit TssF [Deltaproteobacteria bacterium]